MNIFIEIGPQLDQNAWKSHVMEGEAFKEGQGGFRLLKVTPSHQHRVGTPEKEP